MPVKRNKEKQRKFQISDEAVELFIKARELDPRSDVWEEDGGRRREYLTTYVALHNALGLKIWQAGPLDVNEYDSVCAGGQPWIESVPRARELRLELMETANAR
jgi:hypothetical protein